MPFTKGLLLIAAFSVTWGAFAGLAQALLHVAGMSSGTASVGLSLVVGFLAAIGALELLDRIWLQRRPGCAKVAPHRDGSNNGRAKPSVQPDHAAKSLD